MDFFEIDSSDAPESWLPACQFPADYLDKLGLKYGRMSPQRRRCLR